MFFYSNHKVIFWLTLLALLGGICTAIGIIVQGLLSVVFFGGIAMVVLAVSCWYVSGAKSGNLFVYLSLASIFIFPFFLKLAGLRFFGIWQILLMIGGGLGLPYFIRHVRVQPVLLISCCFFAGFIFWSALSSLVSERFNLYAFLYQFISDLKPLLLISFSFFAWNNLSAQKVLWWLIDYFYLVIFVFVAVEWIMPGYYFSIFGGVGGVSTDSNGILPSRALGPFEHPSFLASITACFAMLACSRACCQPIERIKYAILSAIYLVFLLCSVQRQELVGALVAICAMLFIAKSIKWSSWHVLVLVLAMAIVPLLIALFGADAYREAGAWGLGTVSEIAHPRAQQYAAAFIIANEHFPFGTGLGTFGGAGAEKYDLSLYYEMGFGRYWWFGTQDFLLDTYWPNSIAESGWIGFALLLAHYFILGLYALKNARIEPNGLASCYWLFAGLGVWFLIANAFSSPAFQDPRLYFWVAMAMALAHFTGKSTIHAEKI